MNPKAEAIRIKYKYRRMILRGEIKVPHEVSIKLLGPDCAYHLYGRWEEEKRGKGKGRRGKQR
jgi:hypothetical protein